MMSNQPQQTGIRLVCFDIGGVVVRICRTWAQGCAAAGMDVRDPSLWQTSGPGRRALILQYQTGRIDGPTFADRASTLVGGLYSPVEIMGIHHAWLLGEHERIADLVDCLHWAGVDTAALSNTNHEHWVRMGDFPAVMRIHHHLASHLVGLHKPDPQIYHRLEQQVGHAGSEILFFDDSPENVTAARAVGWRAEWIDPAGDPAAQIAEMLGVYGVDVSALGS